MEAVGPGSRYRILRALGRGGTSRVYLAEDAQRGRRVALKLLDRAGPIEGAEDRLLRVVRTMSRYRHPSLATLLDHGIDPDGRSFLVYEYLEGRDLEAVLATGDPESPSALFSWGRDLGSALGWLHECGVIHRDVKPANVILREDGRAVLCDFGLLRPLGPRRLRTPSGVLLGTPEYLAPEIWCGEPPSPSSDQWAWAAILFRLQYGRSVYPGETPREINDFVQAGTALEVPRDPEGRVPGLRPFFLRALARRPRDRFADMGTALVALDEAQATLAGDSARPSATRTRQLAPIRRPRGTPTRRIELGSLRGRRTWSVPILRALLAVAALAGLLAIALGP